MNRLAIILGALGTTVLAACVTVTPYQPVGPEGGYSEQKLQADRYRITFAGNASTPRQTVENYLLYRAAELTLASGFDYFLMADRSTDAATRYSQRMDSMGGYGWYGWYPRGGMVMGSSTPSTEYEAQAEILMVKGAKPAGDVRAFDARDVQQNLEAVIDRPKPAEAPITR